MKPLAKDCNLIVSFHPIIFKGLKKLTGKTYVERVVIKAIQHNIAIFSIHTALDNALQGVNDIICNKLGLNNKQILIPQTGTIKKLTTYVPKANAHELRAALFEIGAGHIGNYDSCSFNTDGTGTYRGNEDSNPTIGEQGILHEEEETQVSVTFLKHLESKIVSTLFKTHPYEEVAYEITTLDNKNQTIGMGMIGELENPKSETEALEFIKARMNASCIRHSQLLDKPIRKIAVLGGSGAFAIGNAAKGAGADSICNCRFKISRFF